MFNRRKSFYAADIVILVAVRGLKDYDCVVLRAKDAERAAQFNVDRGFRRRTKKGTKPRPHKVATYIVAAKRERKRRRSDRSRRSLRAERAILKRGLNAWHILNGTN